MRRLSIIGTLDDFSHRMVIGRGLFRDFLLAGNRDCLTLAGAGVCLGALTTDRETLLMTATAVAVDFLEAFDIRRDLTSKVTFDDVFLELLADLVELLFGEGLDLASAVDSECFEYLHSEGTTHAIEIRKCNVRMFTVREVDTSYSRHNDLIKKDG